MSKVTVWKKVPLGACLARLPARVCALGTARVLSVTPKGAGAASAEEPKASNAVHALVLRGGGADLPEVLGGAGAALVGMACGAK